MSPKRNKLSLTKSLSFSFVKKLHRKRERKHNKKIIEDIYEREMKQLISNNIIQLDTQLRSNNSIEFKQKQQDMIDLELFIDSCIDNTAHCPQFTFCESFLMNYS